MRRPCLDCVRKHISTALAAEDHAPCDRALAVFTITGNLLEASSEIRKIDPAFATALYKLAFAAAMLGDRDLVDFEALLSIVDNLETETQYSVDYDKALGMDKISSEISAVGMDSNGWLFYANMAQASVLFEEVWNGYYNYKDFIIGHLNLAAICISKVQDPKQFCRKLAQAIREYRLMFSDDPSTDIPYFKIARSLKLRRELPPGTVDENNEKLPDDIIGPLNHDASGELLVSEDTRPVLDKE
jgi:hypothetical protein